MSIAESGLNQELLILEKAKRGDTQAFSTLIQLYQERMLRSAYSFLGNREDARDCAQEAFVKAYEGLKKFKGDSKFSSWLYRILMNTCKDFLRKKKSRPQWAEKPEDEDALDPVEQAPSFRPDALAELLNQETGTLIREAADKLPIQQKAVFTLRYFEGLSLEEIAGALDLSVGAVKAHLWQAAQKMQKNLSEFISKRREE